MLLFKVMSEVICVRKMQFFFNKLRSFFSFNSNLLINLNTSIDDSDSNHQMAPQSYFVLNDAHFFEPLVNVNNYNV